MTRPLPVVAIAACLSLLLAEAARTQQMDSTPVRTSPVVVKYGKWVTLAAAIGMGIQAATAHHAADRAYSNLTSYCYADTSRCTVGRDGAYLDPVAEHYYQTSLHQDTRARRWLVGGEAAMLGTAGLFVWELTRPKQAPRNIPFEPTVEFLPGTTRVGLRASF